MSNTGPVKRREPIRLNIPPRYLLLLVTILCILLMAVTYFTDILNGPLSGFASYVIVPFQDGISQVGEWIIEKEQLVHDIEQLQEENAALKEENEELATLNQELLQERIELEELRELFELDATYTDLEKTGARIISKDSGSWYHSFIINKGTADGLEVDMNVLSGGGLVGRITYIGTNWARVKTIIDDDSNVSATVLSTQNNIVVSGNLTLYEEGVIEFSELVDPDDEVKVGDSVVTSNISDKFLSGILIGYITEIYDDPNNLTKSGTITPVVDFTHLDTVLVVLENKQTVDEDAQVILEEETDTVLQEDDVEDVSLEDAFASFDTSENELEAQQ